MKAWMVLNDCKTSLDWLNDVTDEAEFRIKWVGLVALLRAVGHVLNKVDGKENPAIRKVIDSQWNGWKSAREANRIFWEFIEDERNSVLKTYEMGYIPGTIPIAVEGGEQTIAFELVDCILKPLADGPFAGEDCRDVAMDAINWWAEQLTQIESRAKSSG